MPTESELELFAESLDPLRRDQLVFAAITGIRKSKVTLCQRDWLRDDARHINYPAVVKKKKPVEIAFNDEARKLILSTYHWARS